MHKLTKEPLQLGDRCYLACVDEGPKQRDSTFARNEEQFHPVRNENTFNVVSLLKACKDLGTGSKLYTYVHEHTSLAYNRYVASELIGMYVRRGALVKAQQVLDGLPVSKRDVVTWNALIAGYVNGGQGERALECVDIMQLEGHSADAVTFTYALKACGSIGALAKGEQFHDKIVNLHMLEDSIMLGSALVDMYARCGALVNAQQVFDGLSAQNVVTWTVLIGGYTQQGQGNEALKCFDNMLREGHFPNAVTFTYALNACGSIGAVARGEQIHYKIVNFGMLEKDTVVGNALVDMYARCGALAKAQQVLNELPVLMRNVVTWNTLISGYAKYEKGKEALKCFDHMQLEGHTPDAITFTCALKACGSIGAVAKGEQIHETVVSLGILDKDTVLGSSLLDMYVKCGAIEQAQQVFDKLPVQNRIMWTTLIAGYVQHGQDTQALECFDRMQRGGHSPNAVTYTCALKACGSIGAIFKGRQMHDKIMSSGIVDEVVLGSTLVEMYARCGAIENASQVFHELSVRDVVTWTSLLAGYAQQGQGEEALDYFERMQAGTVKPGPATLVCMVNACSHSGLLDQAQMYFARMRTEYGIIPDVEHYCCMVDVFGRAGNLDKALEIEKICCDLTVWHVVLGACCKWQDVKIGNLAFGHALNADNISAAPYICMANIFKAAVK